jgi:type III restriction enzyme
LSRRAKSAGSQQHQEEEELLRELVDTVGKPGQIGQDLQNVVSVAMLSEGWDAKTVTHIMGLRAFTSQLLCEQVIGRGLRRVAYDIDPETGLYAPEFVNVWRAAVRGHAARWRRAATPAAQAQRADQSPARAGARDQMAQHPARGPGGAPSWWWSGARCRR